MAVKRKGLDTILKNLNKEISLIEGDVQKGLTLGGLLIKGTSQENTPVDTGNLRGSHYLVSKGGRMDQTTGGEFNANDKSGKRVAAEHSGKIGSAKSRIQRKKAPFIEIGVTAFYGERVHEDLEARHPTGKAKFLEDAIKSGQNQLLETIKRFAKR